ncbi:hypothetical protein BPNPMPFG_001317 [Mesorhizobium sp. AR07]|uniref:hypothetical protein n=1 Tax=Mesorhizobium sp. AR07 TaxID=2865838 RepID=UPI0021601E32|nr:hypothetical protein [Mesorhizobium sp. AR07]UVK45754.1 hypothetical protein BPNPMPFG_001317 [Mesorhizobium sp. AR07]
MTTAAQPHLASIKDAVYALWLKRIAIMAMRFSFVLKHVVVPKPLCTFGRHATQERSNHA